MSITVIRAGFSHGYSGYDHLLDDNDLDDLIGRQFPSLAAAKRAGDKLARHDRRCAGAPVWIAWNENGHEYVS